MYSYYDVGFVGCSTWFISCESCRILVGYWFCCCWYFLLSTASTCTVPSTLSSCEINGILGAITLGDATVIGNLGVGTVIGILRGVTVDTSLGTTLLSSFFGCCGCLLLNSVDSLSMFFNRIYPIVKGVLSPGLFNACINSLAALVAFSVVNNQVKIRCCVNNSTSFACIFSLVFGL